MAAVSSILAGAALIGAGSQVYQADKARKEAKSEMKKQQAESRQLEAQQKDKQKRAEMTQAQRLARQQQLSSTSGSKGREGTILGGATGVGNTGTQAASGANKTLLGT